MGWDLKCAMSICPPDVWTQFVLGTFLGNDFTSHLLWYVTVQPSVLLFLCVRVSQVLCNESPIKDLVPFSDEVAFLIQLTPPSCSTHAGEPVQ